MPGPARRCAVLGSPIGHSLSPALHRAAYAHLGLDWTYEAVEVAEAGLAGFLGTLDGAWRGLSLTMPLKRAVLPFLDVVQPLAALVGAANTVVLDGLRPPGSRRYGSRLQGSNTDVPGLVAALAERGVRLAPAARILVLGAGATAASTVAAIAELCPPGQRARLVLAVRDSTRAAPVIALAGRVGLVVEVIELATVESTAAAALAAALAADGAADGPRAGAFDLVVSTLPAGAVGPETARAVARAVAGGGAICDVVYDGWPTPLAAAAAAAGLVTVSGTDLLVHQARGQVAVFTGRPVPVDILRGALPARLREPSPPPAHHSRT